MKSLLYALFIFIPFSSLSARADSLPSSKLYCAANNGLHDGFWSFTIEAAGSESRVAVQVVDGRTYTDRNEPVNCKMEERAVSC